MILLSDVMWNRLPHFNRAHQVEIKAAPSYSCPGAIRFEHDGGKFLFHGNSSPFNPDDAIKICRSKIDMHALVTDSDFFPDDVCIPETYAYFDPDFYDSNARDEKYRLFRSSVEEICGDVANRIDFPLVVKPNAQSMSADAFIVTDRDGLAEGIDTIFTFHNRYDPNAIVQEYVPVRKEFRAVCFDGKCHILLEKQGADYPEQIIGRSLTHDWLSSRFVRDERLERIAGDISLFFIEHIGLRYGGFDLALDVDELGWMFEANTAPMTNYDSLVKQDGGLEAAEGLADAMLHAMLD